MCKLSQKNLQKKKEKASQEERPRVPKTLGTFGDNHNGKHLNPFW